MDGISLTIQSYVNNSLTVGIIPHTIKSTNLKNKKLGDAVNLEFDNGESENKIRYVFYNGDYGLFADIVYIPENGVKGTFVRESLSLEGSGFYELEIRGLLSRLCITLVEERRDVHNYLGLSYRFDDLDFDEIIELNDALYPISEFERSLGSGSVVKTEPWVYKLLDTFLKSKEKL